MSSIKRLENGTVELILSLSWPRVKKVYEKLFDQALSQVKVKGFRSGKAPRKIAGKQIDKKIIREEVIKKLLPQIYQEAIDEHQLRPIIEPKIQIISFEENKTWQFKAQVCEQPRFQLGKYKEAVKSALASTKIWTPKSSSFNNKKTPSGDQSEGNGVSGKIAKVLKALLEEIKIEIPELLIEKEQSRLLANLLEEIKKLGLTLDSYLQSVAKTAEQLRRQYQEEAEKTIKLEFIISAIADDLKIQVAPEEIEKLIKKAKKEDQEKLKNQSYFLTTILRRQKTLDKLLSL